jgi:hypothetical protein
MLTVAFAFLSVIPEGNLLLNTQPHNAFNLQPQIEGARLQPCQSNHSSNGASAPEVRLDNAVGRQSSKVSRDLQQGCQMKRKYIPVEEAFAEWRKDPAFVAAYDALEEEFALASARIKTQCEDVNRKPQHKPSPSPTTNRRGTASAVPIKPQEATGL